MAEPDISERELQIGTNDAYWEMTEDGVLRPFGTATLDLNNSSTSTMKVSVASVAAAGTTAANATALTAQHNAVTAADGTKGVSLPAAVIGLARYVINTVTTASLKVYPVDGGNDQINGQAEDVAFILAPGQAAWFLCTSATQWYATQASGVTAVTAEHGAGAIGTAAAPVTYRWVDRGVIITQTKIDLTGLASVATANDVIGLAAGGAAYIGRNVVATNGIIYKTEFACIETPAGGDNDVNVVANSSAVLAYDGAGGTTYLSNSGDLLAGQTIENLVPALTANDYFYLTAGTGDTAATYTAGMYVLTTYGHALLA